jgi:hypothetical protein
MNYHDRRPHSVTPSDLDNVEFCPCHLDDGALCRMNALKDQDTGLSDQGQDCERRHEQNCCH